MLCTIGRKSQEAIQGEATAIYINENLCDEMRASSPVRRSLAFSCSAGLGAHLWVGHTIGFPRIYYQSLPSHMTTKEGEKKRKK